MTDIDRMSATIEELQQAVEHYKGCADDWYKVACGYKDASEQLREDYAALLRLHNTTAQAARAEECAMRLERRKGAVEDGA